MKAYFRKSIGLYNLFCFIILLATGVMAFFDNYSRVTATIHIIFGFMFSVGVMFHLLNNFEPLKRYIRAKVLFIILPMVLMIFLGAYFQLEPFELLINYSARSKAGAAKELNISNYEIIKKNVGKDIQLSIDLLRSHHYWHPQMAIWIEDLKGNYIESLYVTNATAKGLFFGGRSKSNFKKFDEKKDSDGGFRRVDALPVWSHKRGVIYEDGLFAPTYEHPLPDAISGATITDNFQLISSVDRMTDFVLNIEINIAFDDNEYYSDFDFPDDEIFHSGTGQLGQPSIVFQSVINTKDEKNYYLMQLIGHGHHSGQTGMVYGDLSTLTTAKEIVERIVVGVKTLEDG